MRKLKGYIIGMVFGGLLLSGGWFTYAAIQSEVGINVWSGSIWSKALSVNPANQETEFSTVVGRIPAVALYAKERTTGDPTALRIDDVGSSGLQVGDMGLITMSTVFGTNEAGSSSIMLRTSDPQVGNLTPTIQMLNTAAYNRAYNGAGWDRVHGHFKQVTNSITTNAAGTVLVMSEYPMSKYSMQIDRTAGTTDVVEVDLECSLDTNQLDFTQIATITTLVGEPVLTTATDTPCLHIRYNVVTVGAGNTLQIHLVATR